FLSGSGLPSCVSMAAIELDTFVSAVAGAFSAADAMRPVAVSRSGRVYQPGIGPHNENAAVALMLEQLRREAPYDQTAMGQFVAYPQLPRQKCDVWAGDPLDWVIEVKMARFVGDNGKPDDTAVKDLLSPYAVDHSAVSDCMKLAASGFECRKAVLIYGFENT